MRIREFQRINEKRCTEAFHNNGAKGWSIQNWLLALAGEVGEACNLAKKIMRGDFLLEQKRGDLLKELADVITYADLGITNLGGDTESALLSKFGEVSRRVGWERKIESVYLAAGFGAQEHMRNFRRTLQANGIKVTSRWLNFEFTTLPHDETAVIDLHDIDSADGVLVFTEWPSTQGGMHVEFGYALALGKEIAVIGQPVNNFYCLTFGLQRFDSFDDWLKLRTEVAA